MAGVILIIGGILAVILFLSKKAEGKTLTPIPTIINTDSTAKYPYFNEVGNAANRYGVDANLIAAVISWEQRSATRWDPNAVNPSDPSYGLGQITPYIGVRFGAISSEEDYSGLFDPQKNINAVAAFLDYLLNDEKNSLDVAIQMYNLGEPKYWEGKRVPEYLAGVKSYLEKFRGW